MSIASKLVDIPDVKLSDGNSMPILGFGTCAIHGSDAEDPGYIALVEAIRLGYRFIDTAAMYLNEEVVGKAVAACIKDGIVKREELFVCTKVWSTFHKRDSVMKSCKESLQRLAMDYVDLLLVHWPMGFQEGGDPHSPVDSKGRLVYSDVHYTETWQGMEVVKEAGLAKSIGVSNFNRKMIEDLLATCKHRPTVNQVECHVYLSQVKLHEFSKLHNIMLNAYCPLGSPGACAKPEQPAVLDEPLIKEFAAKYHKTPGQILIRYLVQREIPPVPKSVTPKRIAENADVFDFAIDDGDMEKLLSLNRNLRYCLLTGGFNCSDHPFYPFHDEY